MRVLHSAAIFTAVSTVQVEPGDSAPGQADVHFRRLQQAIRQNVWRTHSLVQKVAYNFQRILSSPQMESKSSSEKKMMPVPPETMPATQKFVASVSCSGSYLAVNGWSVVVATTVLFPNRIKQSTLGQMRYF